MRLGLAPRGRTSAGAKGAARAGVAGTLLVVVALAGCPSSTTTLPYTPYTGINFVSKDVVAGVGCGMEPAQVIAYVVIIGDPTDAGAPNFSALPDGGPGTYGTLVFCYTNGVFASTSTSPDGGPTVQGWIYAYDVNDFQQAAQQIPRFASCAASCTEFTSCVTPTCPLSLSDMQAVVRTSSMDSTYTTTCTATPETADNVQASCLPLVAGPSLAAALDASAEGAASDAAASDSAASDSATPDSAASESDAGDGAAPGD